MSNRKVINGTNKKELRTFALGKAKMFLLWIIKKYGPIHGYGIMKLLHDDEIPIARASRIYPMLNAIEKEEFIKGVKTKLDNRLTKVYKITNKGKHKIIEENKRMPKILKQFSKEVLCS